MCTSGFQRLINGLMLSRVTMDFAIAEVRSLPGLITVVADDCGACPVFARSVETTGC